jgi:hypothetical protein
MTSSKNRVLLVILLSLVAMFYGLAIVRMGHQPRQALAARI